MATLISRVEGLMPRLPPQVMAAQHSERGLCLARNLCARKTVGYVKGKATCLAACRPDPLGLFADAAFTSSSSPAVRTS